MSRYNDYGEYVGLREPIKLRCPIIFDKSELCEYDKPYGYIYMIVNKVNGHMYIGQKYRTIPKIDKSYWGSGERLKLSMTHFRLNNFDRIVLEWVNAVSDIRKECQDFMDEREKFWIDVFDTYKFPQHYNLTSGGEVFLQDEESSRKISEKMTGKMTGSKNPRAKSVVQLTKDFEFVREFSCVPEVKEYGFSVEGVYDCCIERQRTGIHKGYR